MRELYTGPALDLWTAPAPRHLDAVLREQLQSRFASGAALGQSLGRSAIPLFFRLLRLRGIDPLQAPDAVDRLVVVDVFAAGCRTKPQFDILDRPEFGSDEWVTEVLQPNCRFRLNFLAQGDCLEVQLRGGLHGGFAYICHQQSNDDSICEFARYLLPLDAEKSPHGGRYYADGAVLAAAIDLCGYPVLKHIPRPPLRLNFIGEFLLGVLSKALLPKRLSVLDQPGHQAARKRTDDWAYYTAPDVTRDHKAEAEAACNQVNPGGAR